MLTSPRLLAAAAALTGTLVLGTASPALAQGHHHGGIPFTAATATQQADGSFALTWTAPGVHHVTVYAGQDRDRIAQRKPVARAAGSTTVTVTLPAADRWYFELVPDHGDPLTIADRDLHLASAPNFRDAGGYRTTDGRWVRMGEVYRSGDLSKLSAADLAKLQRLGIAQVYDLRTPAEQQAAPDKLPAGATEHSENVLGVAGTGAFDVTTPAAAVQAMEDAERTMVAAPSAKSAYQAVLDSLAARGDGGTVLYHCTAGKDRTGWASAVLLTALGVPRDTVMSDYLASNTYRAQVNAATLAQLPAAYQPVYKPLLEVRPEYLNAGFDEVAKDFGGFDAYLHDGLGLTHQDLRELKEQLLAD
ncbi:tyrosine-protein phosphatase [Kitasatospora viridis]|uniref:Protein-tyrosine phosphatase n=1 Tax=Kitasatospora viridis TaxID=281105 RepID=A0A561UGQ5_9ACTN|nr:tyrosine-protein phosphatase [Kitasatospora viridis]TWF98549.1 protein-tyrosine phosphatase [Kitasatospora viridis]